MYRILIVDDEEMIRRLIAKYAVFEGHTDSFSLDCKNLDPRIRYFISEDTRKSFDSLKKGFAEGQRGPSCTASEHNILDNHLLTLPAGLYLRIRMVFRQFVENRPAV